MDYSVYKISLDIHKPEAQEVLEMKLLDSKRRIQISLTENGKVYQITPDCKAMFSAGKSDGNKIYNQCEIIGNTIIYDVTQQTLACLGEVDCEVQLLGSDEAVITSPRFSIIVHDRVYNGEDIVDSETETNVLPDLIAKSHEHDNKEVLDGITQELLDQIGSGTGGGGGLTPEQLADLEANTAARHEHANKDLLDTITKEMVAEEIPAVHILPPDAKDGDMCLYAPMNTITLEDVSKRIYFDWEKIAQPLAEGEETINLKWEARYESAHNYFEIEVNRSTEECYVSVLMQHKPLKVKADLNIIFSSGELNKEKSYYEYTPSPDAEEVTITYNDVSELPAYIHFPTLVADEITKDKANIDEPYYWTEYRLMVYQGGEWREAVESGVSEAEMQKYINNAVAEINTRIDGIEGGIDEIEAMIDESGVLDG